MITTEKVTNIKIMVSKIKSTFNESDGKNQKTALSKNSRINPIIHDEPTTTTKPIHPSPTETAARTQFRNASIQWLQA